MDRSVVEEDEEDDNKKALVSNAFVSLVQARQSGNERDIYNKLDALFETFKKVRCSLN